LVEAGLVKQLEEIGWNVKFDGHQQFISIHAESDPPMGIVKNPRLVSQVTKAVADVVSLHAEKGQLPVTLGGDHSLVRCYQLSHIVVLIVMNRRWEPSRAL
jgi:arginase